MQTLVSTLVILSYIVLFALVLWFITIRPHLPMRNKISGLFQLLAIYTFTMGMLSALGVFSIFSNLERNLTSSDPLLFLIGNLDIFVVIFSAMSVALDPNTITLVALPVLLVLFILLFVYAIVHFLVIVPLAYFSYLITSVPIDAILNASTNIEITLGTETVRIKELVMQNEIAMRNFAVGIPAFVVSLILKIWPLIYRKQPGK